MQTDPPIAGLLMRLVQIGHLAPVEGTEVFIAQPHVVEPVVQRHQLIHEMRGVIRILEDNGVELQQRLHPVGGRDPAGGDDNPAQETEQALEGWRRAVYRFLAHEKCFYGAPFRGIEQVGHVWFPLRMVNSCAGLRKQHVRAPATRRRSHDARTSYHYRQVKKSNYVRRGTKSVHPPCLSRFNEREGEGAVE